ncbi:MAG: enoyl-CoA hydratase/isomerase family protein [Propionibacteriaceae bacterium]
MIELQPSPTTEDVLWGIEDGVGYLVLNRPRPINSLTTSMCQAIVAALSAWEHDALVTSVDLTGVGRGLCAGGDVVMVRQSFLDGEPERGLDFFRTEYAMDAQIAHYPKPITVHQHGFVMGGGLGISAHASKRIVSTDARIAMPETIIGFFPDVGVCWELAKAPGELGKHIAVTGIQVGAADAVLLGFADEIDGDDVAPPVLEDADWVRECYAGTDAAAIIARLEASQVPAAQEAAALIRQRSPLSVWVAIEAIERARAMNTIDEVFAQDLALTRATVTNSDFCEGVRAQLVDKDKNPTWRHARIEDVDPALVQEMFLA